MRSHKHSSRDRVEALNALNSGAIVADVCTALNISPATLYSWKNIYAGLSVEAVDRLDRLEQENSKLRHCVKMLELDKKILQEIVHLQDLQPHQKRALINSFRKQFQVSLARISRLLNISRSIYAYQPVPLAADGQTKQID